MGKIWMTLELKSSRLLALNLHVVVWSFRIVEPTLFLSNSNRAYGKSMHFLIIDLKLKWKVKGSMLVRMYVGQNQVTTICVWLRLGRGCVCTKEHSWRDVVVSIMGSIPFHAVCRVFRMKTDPDDAFYAWSNLAFNIIINYIY